MNEDVMVGYIYKITSPVGEVYIGQTLNISKRKMHYAKFDFHQQRKLWKSYEMYNWNPIDTFEIIEEIECTNRLILNEREMYWISFYNSFLNGLNCNKGGEGNLGYIHTDESKLKMTNSLNGVKHPEWRNKQKSEYTKGRKHTSESKLKISENKRAKMNDDIKRRISEGLKNNKNGIGNKGSSKKVKCINNDIVYESIKFASEELKVSVNKIIDVCKGKISNTKGYIFEYCVEK